MARTRSIPIPGAPALLIEPGRGAPFLVVADLHLGLGAPPGWADGPADGSSPALAGELERLAETTGTRSLVIAGDVKHPIVGTPRGLRRVIFDFFAELLSDGIQVEVVLGNHDAGLRPALPAEVVVHPSTGVARSGFGIFHGHRWPSEEVLRQPHLVAGHLHPGARFAPSAELEGSKRRCWVRATFPPAPRSRVRGAPARRFRARDLAVLPPFNPLAGTESLNRTRPSRGRSFLFGRFLSHGESRLYLLDGTDLGALRTGSVPRERTRPGAGPRRR